MTFGIRLRSSHETRKALAFERANACTDSRGEDGVENQVSGPR